MSGQPLNIPHSRMLLEGLPRIAEHLRQFCLSCCGNCPFPPEVSVRRLLGETSEAMLVLDTSGAIAFANPALCALSGVSVESLHNQPVETLLTGRSASRLRSAVKQGGLPTPLPLTLIRHNGREIDMSGQVHPVLDGTGSACGHVVLLAEEVESERRTKPSRSPWEKVRRVMATESACNRALVRAQSEEDLYAAICRAVVEEGGYRMAWVGLAERSQERAVRPVAQAGFEKGYLKTIRVTWADNEHGRGPVGTAIRTGQPAIVNNIEINPAFAPWRRQARERGYTSCVALPLKTGLHVLGTLAIYATEEDAFDADAMALLTRLANTLAYGVTAMRIRQENEQVKQDLEETARQLERRNAERHAKLDNLQRDLARETFQRKQAETALAGDQATLEIMQELLDRPCLVLTPRGMVMFLNEQATLLLGVEAKQCRGCNVAGLLPSELALELALGLDKAMARGEPVHGTHGAAGDWSVHPVTLDGGTISRLVLLLPPRLDSR